MTLDLLSSILSLPGIYGFLHTGPVADAFPFPWLCAAWRKVQPRVKLNQGRRF
jgi:hypothetical protein